ncbi:putative transcription factor GeBP family [Arabidopsis thaliana]
MAKNKTLVTPSTAKKSSDVAYTSKKPSRVASPAKKPSGVTSPVKKPLEVVASTSSEEEEEDESSSDSESGSESDAAAPSSSNTKRQSEGEPEEKRAKTETETGKKPLLFQRLWTDEDEIVFLQGMIKFAKDTGKNVSEDMNGFFEKLKDSFSFESMISDGDATALVKPKKKKLKVDEESDWFERSFVDGAFKELGPGVDEETWKKNWSLVPVKKRKRIEEKVKSMQADELKTTWQKIDVVHEMRSLMAKYV